MLQTSMGVDAWMLSKSSDPEVQAGKEARQLYARVRASSRLRRLWSALLGRSNHLLSLTEIGITCGAHNSHYAGLQTVPIRRIHGSEGRSGDFDSTFNPLGEHNRNRWLSVATAWQLGIALPPVELIQVGEVYFVRDGHHRISVARAQGQEDIDAEVWVWQTSGAAVCAPLMELNSASYSQNS
jgi:hypothetical protein